MVILKSGAQVKQEQEETDTAAAQAADASKPETPNIKYAHLVGFLRSKWQDARRAKLINIEPQMFKNIRQATNIYDPTKLSAIRALGGADVFLGYTKTKCRNLIAWIRDIYFQPNSKPYGLEPTPVPELAPALLQEINSMFFKKTMDGAMAMQAQSGAPFDMGAVVLQIQAEMPNLQLEIKKAIKVKAQEKAEEILAEVDDKLVEGKWYEALYQCIPDLVITNNAFIKGPIKRYKTVRKIVPSEGGQDRIDLVREIVSEYERRSPFDIYPEPDSTGIDDGYLFDHVAYRRTDLQDMIGVPGFDEAEIRAVLREHITGGLREWTGIEAERAEFEKRDQNTSYTSDKIEGLEFYGPVPGPILMEYGINVPDPDIDYEMTASMIGNHIIQAVINKNPAAGKPFSTASFDENADSFWGDSFCQNIDDIQGIVNSGTRGLVNNVGMGSGPQVDINVDRLVGGARGDTSIVPWKKWLTTNRLQQSGNAINFFQPNMHAQELLTVISGFSKMGDERGVPAYAHGDSQVGGAGNTASGLSMLITQSTRVTKDVIRSIDMHLVVGSIENQIDEIMSDAKYISKIGDLKLVAKGTSALIEKQEKAAHMAELLNNTNNPVDNQITGIKGRAYLLGETAKTYDLDQDKFLAGMASISPENQMAPSPMSMPNAGTPAAPRNLDLAGNTPSGADNQLITGGGGHAAIPPAA